MGSLLILGGGPAGLSAAIRARKLGRRVLLLHEGELGGSLSCIPRVDSFPGLQPFPGADLADALISQARALGVLFAREQVRQLLPGPPHRVRTEAGTYDAEAVIIATGTLPRRLGLAREDTLPGVCTCPLLEGPACAGKDAAVAGGGSAALQCAEFLTKFCNQVHLIHRSASFRSEPALLARVTALSEVSLHPFRQVKALVGKERLTGLILQSPRGPEELPVDALFVCIGREANTAPFRGVLEMDGGGFLRTHGAGQTSVPGIFAAGGCRDGAYLSLLSAMADGVAAASAACKT